MKPKPSRSECKSAFWIEQSGNVMFDWRDEEVDAAKIFLLSFWSICQFWRFPPTLLDYGKCARRVRIYSHGNHKSLEECWIHNASRPENVQRVEREGGNKSEIASLQKAILIFKFMFMDVIIMYIMSVLRIPFSMQQWMGYISLETFLNQLLT